MEKTHGCSYSSYSSSSRAKPRGSLAQPGISVRMSLRIIALRDGRCVILEKGCSCAIHHTLGRSRGALGTWFLILAHCFEEHASSSKFINILVRRIWLFFIPVLRRWYFVTKQVHSDNDASEVDILGHLAQFGKHVDEFGAFRLSSHFRLFSPVIGSLRKKTRDGPKNPRTDGQTFL